mgnify:CR=1 FL=1
MEAPSDDPKGCPPSRWSERPVGAARHQSDDFELDRGFFHAADLIAADLIAEAGRRFQAAPDWFRGATRFSLRYAVCALLRRFRGLAEVMRRVEAAAGRPEALPGFPRDRVPNRFRPIRSGGLVLVRADHRRWRSDLAGITALEEALLSHYGGRVVVAGPPLPMRHFWTDVFAFFRGLPRARIGNSSFDRALARLREIHLVSHWPGHLAEVERQRERLAATDTDCVITTERGRWPVHALTEGARAAGLPLVDIRPRLVTGSDRYAMPSADLTFAVDDGQCRLFGGAVTAMGPIDAHGFEPEPTGGGGIYVPAQPNEPGMVRLSDRIAEHLTRHGPSPLRIGLHPDSRTDAERLHRQWLTRLPSARFVETPEDTLTALVEADLVMSHTSNVAVLASAIGIPVRLTADETELAAIWPRPALRPGEEGYRASLPQGAATEVITRTLAAAGADAVADAS